METLKIITLLKIIHILLIYFNIIPIVLANVDFFCNDQSKSDYYFIYGLLVFCDSTFEKIEYITDVMITLG